MRSQREALERVQSELAAAKAELAERQRADISSAIDEAARALETEQRRLARLRAEFQQLGPRVEHLKQRALKARAPIELPPGRRTVRKANPLATQHGCAIALLIGLTVLTTVCLISSMMLGHAR